MTRDEEIAGLDRRIAAREGQSGFKANVEALKRRKAELEAQQPE